MKIFILTKRQTTNNDILDSQFGRIRALTLGLAKLGHEVRGSCLSYQKKAEGEFVDADSSDTHHVHWQSLNAGAIKPLGFLKYEKLSSQLIQAFKPDLIISFSDSIYSILGQKLAERFKIKHMTDLQDNYEAYATAKVPGVIKRFRKALAKTDGIICISDRLRGYIAKEYDTADNLLTVENAVCKEVFYPQNKNECRKMFGLPADQKIIGMAGALNRDRGVQTVFDGFFKILERNSDLHLVLAGPRDFDFPKHPQIHDLNTINHQRVPALINALDVAIICNADSPQYTYGFPTKTYEIMACQVPLVATNMGPIQSILADYPECLYTQGNPESFARAVMHQLEQPSIFELDVPSWDDFSKKLAGFIQSL